MTRIRRKPQVCRAERLLYDQSESDVVAFLKALDASEGAGATGEWATLFRLRDCPGEPLVSFLKTFDHIGALVVTERSDIGDLLEAAGYEVSSFQSKVLAREIGAPTRGFRGRKKLGREWCTIELFCPETVIGRLRALRQGRYGEGLHYAFRIDDGIERVKAIDELESLGYFLRHRGFNDHEQQTVQFFDGPYMRIEIVCAGVDR